MERDNYSTYIYAKNGYRRVVMQGDRLIGYLYLGSVPPDSLAFKRIIDERRDHALSETSDCRLRSGRSRYVREVIRDRGLFSRS